MPFDPASVSAVVRHKNLLLERLSHTDLGSWHGLVEEFSDAVLAITHDHPVSLETICADVIEHASGMLALDAHVRDDLYLSFSRCNGAATSAALLSALTTSMKLVAAVPRPRVNLAIHMVVEHLHHHYDQPLTANALARLVGVSRGALSGAFHREMHCTIHQYLTSLRIAQAKRLISRGEKIDAVALLVGYRSKKNFYRQFTGVTGCPPKAWRRVSAA